jgi:histone-lysine N-methyltransferase SUV39H
MQFIANFHLCSQPSENSTQLNGVSPSLKKEPNGSQVTFVSTLAHRAQSLSPQKQKQKSLDNAGFLLSKNTESSSSAYHHSPYDDSGDNELSYHVASTVIPQKRKSQSAEGTDVNDSSDELSLPFVSQNGVLENGIGSSSTGPSLQALGKRPAITPKTPSPAPHLPPQDSVSVVIPSPSAAQRKQMRPSLKPEFIGICERYFPTGREEQIKAQRRAYPTAKAATIDKSVIPFTIAKPTPTKPEPKKSGASLSLARSVFPSHASASNRVTEPVTRASTAKFLRKKLRKKLKRICGGPETLFEIDDEKLAALSANFFFVGDYRLGPGVTPVDDDFLTGCDCGTVCDPNTCRCLIEEVDSDELIVAYERLDSGKVVLRKDFLDRKAMISECSSRCLCAGSDCWNHVVQRGRQVRLEVFDTGERGLGLRCLEPLITGQFVDCYFGEVITKKDADARESANEGKPSYLFNLDWLLGNGHHTYEESYVVDGQKFGSATRFINHSCNPNCKIIPVSTNRLSDQRLYYLAFFAIRDIPANTELTFDYHPKWDQEKQIDPNAVKCLCGEPNCRGQLWPNIRKKGNKEE